MFNVVTYQKFTGVNMLDNLKAITILIATGFVTYWQVKKNDFKNKKREIVLSYQIEVYRKLALAVQRPPEKGSQYFRDMESAVADIQLFGTKLQNEKLKNFLDQWQQFSHGDLNSILSDIRDELRKELGFDRIEEGVRWFRPEGAPELEEIRKKNNKILNEAVL